MALIWDAYGIAFLNVFGITDKYKIHYIYRKIRLIFDGIDDNTRSNRGGYYNGHIASLMNNFVPYTEDDNVMDACFFRAVKWVDLWLAETVRGLSNRYDKLQDLIEFLKSTNGWHSGIVILPFMGPYIDAFDIIYANFKEPINKIRFIVYPGSDSNWRVTPYKFSDGEHRLPVAWCSAGRSPNRLRQLTGCKEATYASPDGRMIAALSKVGAIKIALEALKLQELKERTDGER